MTKLVSLLMIVAGVSLFAAGCGQKGPLVLPQPAEPEPTVETTPPTATTNEQ